MGRINVYFIVIKLGQFIFPFSLWDLRWASIKHTLILAGKLLKWNIRWLVSIL